MNCKPSQKFLVAGVMLVLALLAVCLGSSLASSVPAELEAEVSRFVENVTSGHLHGYLDLVEQFTNPFIYESDGAGRLYFEAQLNELIQQTIIPMLLDRESSRFYQETITYFREKADELAVSYAAKNGDTDDPELAAAIRAYAEEVYLVQLFVWYKIGIAFLEGAIELEPVGPDEYETELLEWLSQSAYLGSAIQLHNETVIVFMNPDLTYSEAVYQTEEGQWSAELSFLDEAAATGGTYILRFAEQNGSWKIAKVVVVYAE